MKHYSIPIIFLLFGAVALCLMAQDRSDTNRWLRQLKVGERNREYFLYIPEKLPKDQPVPLVFVFHGGNGEAKGTMNLCRFNSIADRENFLVVYPQGVGRSWNDGRLTKVTQAHRENVDDLAFFDAILEEVSQNHRIDHDRVYATGISNGGIFSHFLAANRAERIAAIAPVVGGIAEPFDKDFNPQAPVSVLIIQGTDDPLVPYRGGKIAGGGRKDRGSVIGTDMAIQLWVKANGCKTAPVMTTLPDRDPNDECIVEAKYWKEGQNGTEVWLYRIVGGGHTWPGGLQYLPRSLIGRVPHDIDSETIWEFFQTHPK